MPTVSPAPTVQPSLTSNLDKVLAALTRSGVNRKVNKSSELTRGEAAVVLAEVTYLQSEPAGEPFADTANYWGGGQINALKRRGVLKEASGLFHPYSLIRKDDLAVLLERVLVLPDTINFHDNAFRDLPLGSYAYNAVAKLTYFDVMAGQNKNFFRPADTVTAADLAQMLDRIQKYGYPMNPDQHMEKSTATSPPDPDKEPVLQPR